MTTHKLESVLIVAAHVTQAGNDKQQVEPVFGIIKPVRGDRTCFPVTVKQV